MTRALIHIGLSAALVLAPTLCCCQLPGLVARASAHQIVPPAATPAQQPQPKHPCCLQLTTSCCHESPLPTPSPDHKTTGQKPASPRAPVPCVCCPERPVAAQTEEKPSVAAPEPTGEHLPLALAPHAFSPEHLGLTGLYQPERAGVDTRHDTLFVRHVLRC